MAGVVAAGHQETAAAAAAVLKQGGNAFDAAVAGVLAACVAESVLTSAAGGGFLLACPQRGAPALFDFFSQTPRHRRSPGGLDFYPIEADFGDTVQEFHIGLGAMAVPGVLPGLVHVHERLGRLPLKQVVAPAQTLARRGVIVNRFLAYVYGLLSPILLATPASRAIYAPKGRLLQAGDRLYMPGFAAVLDRLVEQPSELLAELAERLVEDCRTGGGYLNADDLKQYQVVERTPLHLDYRGTEFITNPPPSSGGGLIACSLALLADQQLGEYGSSVHLLALSQAMRLTNMARRQGYDDHIHRPDVAAQLLSEPRLRPYRQLLAQTAAAFQVANRLGSTTHLSVIDAEGSAASVTTSNGEGSSYVIPGTDIMVNNMLGEEDLNPQGFHQWAPNQRLSSMMAPTIVLQDGRPSLVLGSGGSNRIRTAILQVLCNLVDFSMPLEAAVVASRIHWENNQFHLEPGFDRGTAQAVIGTAKPVWWQAQNMFFGGVHAVGLSADGTLHGAGDPRRLGAVAFS